MASLAPSHTHPTMGADGTVITVKLIYDGFTQRARMSLRDMIPPVLEHQIRTILHLPSTADLLIERYSDSAAAYVVIDPGNSAVYKQLYRAAKAKSKLKLRVAVKGSQYKVVPKPASVEDAADPEVKPHNPPKTNHGLMPSSEAPSAMAEIPRNLGSLAQTTTNSARTATASANPSVQEMGIHPTPASSQSTPGQHTQEARGISQDSLSDRLRSPGAAPQARLEEMDALTAFIAQEKSKRLAQAASFAIRCNNCDKTVSGSHYHCTTCDDGDFDLCNSCVEQGVTCQSQEHWLIRRIFDHGRLVSSTTETIKPKAMRKTLQAKLPERAAQAKLRQPSETKVAAEAPAPQPMPLPSVALPSRNHSSAPRLSPAPCPLPAAQPQPTSVVYQMPKQRVPLPPSVVKAEPVSPPINASKDLNRFANMRTCNCCVDELHARDFLHCTTCDDYDLCQSCFAKGEHGHHPNHAFTAAVPGTRLPDHITAKLAPGRNQMHHAICDGCDQYVNGVRHKCLDCPDWDFCAKCILNAGFIHPGHRFVPVYEPLKETKFLATVPPVHLGICCDGPLCSNDTDHTKYIRGTRYKCTVCHDMDLCANCEASPSNSHNKTHPLIKFKTPVRRCSVTTTGKHENGSKMPAMGDRSGEKAAGEAAPVESLISNAINAVKTVVDVKPAEVDEPTSSSVKKESPTEKPVAVQAIKEPIDEKKESPVEKKELAVESVADQEKNLKAGFVKDTVPDGSIWSPNVVFEQTWTLRNNGEAAWPAGCSIKFVGGDYMGHVDSTHPAAIPELVSASESTICYSALAPGQDFSFTALLRTPARLGKVISYWRLTTQDGLKFGDRLWCEVNVRNVQAPTPPRTVSAPTESEPEIKGEEDEEERSTKTQGTMIFPKLEKESPISSMHEASLTAPSNTEETGELADFDDCGGEEVWEASDAGFLTDEEYDILDASDEEFLEELQKQAKQE